MTAEERNKLTGIFLLAHGGLQAAVIVFICVLYGVGFALFVGSGEEEAGLVGAAFVVVMLGFAAVALVFILPQLIGGYMLLKERPAARKWGIAGSIFSLLSFPLGTAAGVFGLVFLFGDDGKRFYDGRAVHKTLPATHPAPYNWR